MSYEPSPPPNSIYTSDTTTTAFRPHAPGYTDNNNTYALTVTAPPEVGSYEAKRKRGRPRKYPVDGSVAPPPEFESPAATADGKKPRGRPKGSPNKHHPVVASGIYI